MTTAPDPAPQSPDTDAGEAVRPHTFDGIQEYDKRLPRWWLITLYGAMIFAALYWAYYHTYDLGASPGRALEITMRENADRAERASGVLSDELLWKMSHDPMVIVAGKTTFDTTCAACHKADLTGLIGPNLLDNEWIHGDTPMDVMKTITEGSLLKGMPAWGPVLGKQKIAEVAAYIFSHHKPGEKSIVVPGWTPPVGAVPLPPPSAAQ